ncbi:MAG: hypothetical protein QOF04_1344 [Solirubrobacteraceae bacterium]|nr:hypothetical protein [Solirubrobacteraceae bacterium]
MLAVLALLAALQVPPPQAPPPPPAPPAPPAVPALPPCHDPALALRCPDLVMAAPTNLKAQRLPSGRVVLRMANAIINVGDGPAELFARRSGPREMAASQVISDINGLRRRFPTGAEVYYTSVPTRGGDYWKMDDAARFELYAQQSDGTRGALLRIGPKLRYCLRDLDRVRGWARVPARRVFPACNQSAAKQEVTLGTSVGWADVYPAAYPGNYIEVTGLRGCFVVQHRADPERHIMEISEANNVSARTVRLPYRAGAQRCPAYRP